MEVNIVIVDDTPENLRLLSRILEEEGYTVRPASNGQRALSTVQAAPPDLILLDIKMPGMTGYDVCKQLKADERTREIPIIFISALHDVSEKVKGFATGGVDYITKPFQAEEVLARVETHLALYRLQEHLEDVVAERTATLQQTQEILRKNERQYRLLVQKVNDGIGILQNERVVFGNDVLASLFGSSPEDLIGKTSLELFGRHYGKHENKMTEYVEKGTAEPSWQLLEFTVATNNREQWFEGHQSVITWEGKPAILMTVRDITERKRKEAELDHERKQLRRENIRLRSAMKERYRFGDIIGRSLAMQEVYELVAKASATDAPVMIYGESGTGKDLIAQTIHDLSRRRKKSLVPVNCGAIQESLFEREFFGHRKGSFTGALTDKAGFFDAAHQGTLFLDEIGELPVTLQVKLLRAIDSKGYTAVGDQKVTYADVRIVAATNRNLKQHVEQGLMREDFFYRINVIPITVPPLRERKEDIPLLMEHFLEQYAPGKGLQPLPGKVLETLYNHTWPGNIRQLQNVLQRYLTLKRLDLDDIRTISPVTEATFTAPEMEHDEMELQHAVEQFERQFILNMLNRHTWNRGNTAKALHITRRTLQRKMKQYQLKDTGVSDEET